MRIIKTLKKCDDTTLGNAARGQYSIHLMNRGQLNNGWTSFAKLREEVRDKSSAENRRFFELVSAETHMSVGGIIPRSGPRPKLGLGYFVARVMRNFGLIEKSKGNTAKADEYFAKSIALYEAEDMFETALNIEKMRTA